VSITKQNSSIDSSSDIRIIGMNTDRTRKTYGSDTVYEVCFELSGNPSLARKDIFSSEWKKTNPTQDVCINKGFLVMHCVLKEISTYLPFLKKTFDTANKKYRLYAQEQTKGKNHRDSVSKLGRKAVEDMAKSLHFD
jgi:hypothetical protein